MGITDQDQQEQEQDNNKNNPPPFSEKDKSYIEREETANFFEMIVDLENIRSQEAALICMEILTVNRRRDSKLIESINDAKNELQKKKAAYQRR